MSEHANTILPTTIISYVLALIVETSVAKGNGTSCSATGMCYFSSSTCQPEGDWKTANRGLAPVEDGAFGVNDRLHSGSVGGADEHGRNHEGANDVLNGLRVVPARTAQTHHVSGQLHLHKPSSRLEELATLCTIPNLNYTPPRLQCKLDSHGLSGSSIVKNLIRTY